MNTKIIISLPVPRNNQPFIQRKTQEFNQKLQNDFSENDNIYFSDPGDGRLSRGGDCIPRFYKGQKHLSDQGVAILAGGLKRTIRGVNECELLLLLSLKKHEHVSVYTC